MWWSCELTCLWCFETEGYTRSTIDRTWSCVIVQTTLEIWLSVGTIKVIVPWSFSDRLYSYELFIRSIWSFLDRVIIRSEHTISLIVCWSFVARVRGKFNFSLSYPLLWPWELCHTSPISFWKSCKSLRGRRKPQKGDSHTLAVIDPAIHRGYS